MTGGAAPIVLRPRVARWVAELFAVLSLGTFVMGAVIVPGGPGGYQPLDRAGIVVLGLLVATVLHRLAAVRIVIGFDGLLVINPLRRRQVPWWQIRGVRLERGDPWLILHLVDDETVQAMGVQGSEGAYAREQAMRVARLVVEGQARDRGP